MSWYKISEGLPQNARLALVARQAGLARGEVLALWVYLLDCASRARPRGQVTDALDAEEIAAALDLDVERLHLALRALHDKKMISPSGVLAGWDKSQKTSTARTRAFRARKKEESRYTPLQGDMRERHQKQGRHLAADSTLTPRR